MRVRVRVAVIHHGGKVVQQLATRHESMVTHVVHLVRVRGRGRRRLRVRVRLRVGVRVRVRLRG